MKAGSKKVTLIVGITLGAIASWALLIYVVSSWLPVRSEVVHPESQVIAVESPKVGELLTITNDERKNAGLPMLSLSASLNQTAQTKADDMVKDGYFDHVNPNTNKHGYTYVTDNMPECQYASENLHMHGSKNFTSKEAIDSLMTSPDHREAILDARYDLIGFGISGRYIVQHFCDLR